MKYPWNKANLTGKRFGRWVVLKIAESGSKYKPLIWLCRCDCGKQKKLKTHYLVSGESKSCGCLRRDIGFIRNKSHGMTKTPTYRLWAGMLNRCRNPKGKDYKYYGGKGITVNESWFKFVNFLEDMGEIPMGMEIDRINNNAGYSKDNCRYVTHKTNCRNFSQNRLIEFNGEIKPLVVWASELGINCDALRSRLNRWKNINKSFTFPLRKSRNDPFCKDRKL